MMKKIMMLAMATLLVVSLTAFTSALPSLGTAGSGESTTTRPLDWDTVLYRGTVTGIENTEDGLLVTLKQAKGTVYGEQTEQFLLDNDTSLSFDREQLAKGGYLEVKYEPSARVVSGDKSYFRATSATLYHSAEMVNFNGTFVNYEKIDGGGRLTMTDLENGQEVVFNYSPDHTKLHLNLEELEPGDELNIFHRGVYTMSLPPQASPLEIRWMAQESQEAQETQSFTGKVLEMKDNTALILIDDGQPIRSSGDQVSVEGVRVPLNKGDRVKVEYDGSVRETSPLQVDALSIINLGQ